MFLFFTVSLLAMVDAFTFIFSEVTSFKYRLICIYISYNYVTELYLGTHRMQQTACMKLSYTVGVLMNSFLPLTTYPRIKLIKEDLMFDL